MSHIRHHSDDDDGGLEVFSVCGAHKVEKKTRSFRFVVAVGVVVNTTKFFERSS